MKKYSYILLTFGLVILAAILFRFFFHSITPATINQVQNSYAQVPITEQNPGAMIQLPPPAIDGTISLEHALSQRRSIRSYSQVPLSLEEVSQLLWAAQGITSQQGFRTAPSAGATFPLDIFLVINNVEGLAKGIFKYNPHDNNLEMIHSNDVAPELSRAALGQTMITEAGIVMVFAAVFERTTSRYGERGERYVHNEVGHASQNVHLQAAVLNLGTVVIGAYRDEEAEAILNLDEQYRVLYMMPVGKL